MSENRQIVIFPRGQLNAKDKGRLSRNGIIAVEADDPSKVVCCLPMSPLIGSNDMLVCALQAMGQDLYDKDSFFRARLTEKVIEAHKREKESP